MSKNNKKIIVLGALIVLVLLYIALRKSNSPQHTERSSPQVTGVAPKDFHGIPPEGIGGDPELNRQKNRWAAPAKIDEMTISQIISLPHDALDMMAKDKRSRWNHDASEQAAKSEDHGVQVTGYLAQVREEGPEACNGKSDIYLDFHLWITESPYQNKNTGIVVEAIPFWKEQFPAWKFDMFEKLAFEHAKVRVTGWILWDQEHGDEVGKSRGSCWEVHPITKFEVYSGGRWQELGSEIAVGGSKEENF
jgi:hypothetical protein